MRIPTSKIYRAFPEFDRFDDSTCERYIRAMSAAPGQFVRRWAERLAWLVASVIAVALGVLTGLYVIGRVFDISSTLPDAVVLVLTAVSLFLACTAGPLVVLVIRDTVLRRRIAAQLTLTKCPACRYNLLGVPLQESLHGADGDGESGGGGGVICPECGFVTVFADIAPETAEAIRRAADASNSSNTPRAHPPTEPTRTLSAASPARSR